MAPSMRGSYEPFLYYTKEVKSSQCSSENQVESFLEQVVSFWRSGKRGFGSYWGSADSSDFDDDDDEADYGDGKYDVDDGDDDDYDDNEEDDDDEEDGGDDYDDDEYERVSKRRKVEEKKVKRYRQQTLPELRSMYNVNDNWDDIVDARTWVVGKYNSYTNIEGPSRHTAVKYSWCPTFNNAGYGCVPFSLFPFGSFPNVGTGHTGFGSLRYFPYTTSSPTRFMFSSVRNSQRDKG